MVRPVRLEGSRCRVEGKRRAESFKCSGEPHMSFLRTLETARRSRFAAPVAILLGLAVLLTNEVGHRRALTVIEGREALLEARVEVSLLLREVIAAESSQRGYLLTGRPEYKEPHTHASAQVTAQLTRLAQIYSRWPD